LERYSFVRQFLPKLLDAITFDAAPGGQAVLDALDALRRIEGRRKVLAHEVPLELVTGVWRRPCCVDFTAAPFAWRGQSASALHDRQRPTRRIRGNATDRLNKRRVRQMGRIPVMVSTEFVLVAWSRRGPVAGPFRAGPRVRR